MFNYLAPPNACYEFERIYSTQQWAKKQRWISDYLFKYQPDIIAFQEVFSIESLHVLVQQQGYDYFAVVDEPDIVDDFIYTRPVVAIASRFAIKDVAVVCHDTELAQALGLSRDFSFSRRVLRATVDVPHIGDSDCYVVHFKSKRAMFAMDEAHKAWSAEKTIIEHLKTDIAGGWASTVQRGSEATLLMIDIITRREHTQNPMILMGDFNNNLADGVLSHLLTNSLRFASAVDCNNYLAKYCLNDAWELFIKSQKSSTDPAQQTTATEFIRTPTHYYAASSAVLDYILLSCEFDAGYLGSFYEVSRYDVVDEHLINPVFERDDQSTDHAVVMITLTLRS
ncbi:endonuclease/exonuclease/phosphatase family protein [Pseudoalteromonas mariniglutinosa]|uniref:endonuclease/exonuclease/phosphatase family protein n=1 Tax=Pseudoalteromonas mariniglutinosa TaxID=206042 RepID=UPI00384B0D0D